jgi:transcription initiation factor TFIID TATA-box-binding protein
MSRWEKKLENLVISVSIGHRINLSDFASRASGVEYDPDHFPGAIYRIEEPRVSALIFSSGKVNCTGAKHWDEIPIITEILRKKFEEGGVDCSQIESKVQNLVVSSSLGYGVNIDIAASELPNVEYEPEQFPGLIYRVKDPKCVVLVFTSGKVNVVGAKKWEYIDKALDEVDKKLREINAVMELP